MTTDHQSAAAPSKLSSEEESRQVAEDSREAQWESPSFLKELFLGNFRLDLVHPYPVAETSDRPEFAAFYQRLERFLAEKVDSVAIDHDRKYPPAVIDELRAMGAFGMKVPTEYGGLGFTQVEYGRIMELLSSADANLTALLSAHQSIGVPQPIKIFGTAEQKKRFLPRCAKGAISAFALTEENVGSDPASQGTTFALSEDGESYILNGQKLWCTNGTIAELYVVMARHPQTKKISAFVVEASSEGVKVEHRCYFMGLRALENGVISFNNVRVPRENLIGKEGAGLRIALTTLNTGRLSLPAGCVGAAKRGLETCRVWANERVQWGLPIGRHEAIALKLADMASTTFAMEAVSDLCSELADRGGYDIRLEAACAKEWNSVRGWMLADDVMQIRGGRGYETEQSLANRGEFPLPVERTMRDGRINRVFEGSSEIMHLFMAREAVDTHLQVAGDVIDPKKGVAVKAKALPGIAAFYAGWYPPLWLKGLGRNAFSDFGPLEKHLKFVEKKSRKLAREIFHGMMVHQAGLQYKQGFLFRAVDVGIELFAMTSAVLRAQRMQAEGHPHGDEAMELANHFCYAARDRVREALRGMWKNQDKRSYAVAKRILQGQHTWLETEIVQYDLEELRDRVAGRSPLGDAAESSPPASGSSGAVSTGAAPKVDGEGSLSATGSSLS